MSYKANPKKSTLAGLTASALSLFLLTATADAQTIQVSRENRTIAVTASDKVIVLADTASVHIGFIAYGVDSAGAYANGSRASNAIIQALNRAGVGASEIESENQNVSPALDYQMEKLSPEERNQRKFQVTQSWTVRTPANDAAKMLDVAVKAGANQSGQIEWSLKDENAAQAEAAAKTLQLARTQAEQMAKSLNAKLGDLLYASNEVQAATPRPLMRAMAGAMQLDQTAPLIINPRRIEKSATVYAVFAIQ